MNTVLTVTFWHDHWLVTLLFVISCFAGWKIRKFVDDREINRLRERTGALRDRDERVLNEALVYLKSAHEKVASLIRTAA